MIVDLHLHTNFSDSSRTPEELLAMADEAGLSYMAIADHDTTESYYYARDLAEGYDFDLIPAIEISSYDYERGRLVHLLAYNYDKDENMKEITKETLKKRRALSLKQLGLIQEAGYEIDETRLNFSVDGNASLYKQQIMYALVGQPYWTESYQTLYRKLFKNGGIAQMDIDYPDVFDVMAAAQDDGAKTVLAHPGLFDSFDLIEDLAPAGLDGLEVFHPENNKEERQVLLEIAEREDLIVTGGSDDHGIFGAQHGFGADQVSQESIDRLLA